jgi:hypothetical protein
VQSTSEHLRAPGKEVIISTVGLTPLHLVVINIEGGLSMKVFMKVLMNKKVLAAIAGVLVALGTLFSTIGDTRAEETTEITEVVATE